MSSSCSFERMLSRRNRSKNSVRFSTTESRKIFGLPSSVPLSRSVRWETSATQLVQKGLLGQSDGLVELGGHPAAFLLVQLRTEPLQISRRFDRREVPSHVEESP